MENVVLTNEEICTYYTYDKQHIIHSKMNNGHIVSRTVLKSSGEFVGRFYLPERYGVVEGSDENLDLQEWKSAMVGKGVVAPEFMNISPLDYMLMENDTYFGLSLGDSNRAYQELLFDNDMEWIEEKLNNDEEKLFEFFDNLSEIRDMFSE